MVVWFTEETLDSGKPADATAGFCCLWAVSLWASQWLLWGYALRLHTWLVTFVCAHAPGLLCPSFFFFFCEMKALDQVTSHFWNSVLLHESLFRCLFKELFKNFLCIFYSLEKNKLSVLKCPIEIIRPSVRMADLLGWM